MTKVHRHTLWCYIKKIPLIIYLVTTVCGAVVFVTLCWANTNHTLADHSKSLADNIAEYKDHKDKQDLQVAITERRLTDLEKSMLQLHGYVDIIHSDVNHIQKDVARISTDQKEYYSKIIEAVNKTK